MAIPKQKPGRSQQNFSTPADFIDAVKRRLWIVDFAFDFAADVSNAKASRWFDAERNALSVPKWERFIRDGWGWLNPPFDNIDPWAAMCAQTAADGARIAFLVPASVGSNWFRDHVAGKSLVLFLNGRLAFMPDKPTWGYPKDCMLCLYGPNLRGAEVWTWKTHARRMVAA